MERLAGIIALTGIAAIVAAMGLGPMISPAGFDWMRHTTSEQAAQHLPGAWVMRTGFVAYGLGTAAAMFLSLRSRRAVRGALLLFGLALIGTAVWSNAPILGLGPADMAEDRTHSIMSGIVGTVFALACAASIFAPGGYRRDLLAWVGLIAAVAIPLAMGQADNTRGLLQRAMFAISFAFVLREAFAPPQPR